MSEARAVAGWLSDLASACRERGDGAGYDLLGEVAMAALSAPWTFTDGRLWPGPTDPMPAFAHDASDGDRSCSA